MSDLRFDPVSNQWVAFARNRQERPMEFIPLEQIRQQLMCPFCIGNEDETPPHTALYRQDGSQVGPQDEMEQWTVRVVPNKYPSFRAINFDRDEKPVSVSATGPYQAVSRPGVQELIIPTPRHVTSISELNEAELLVSFRAYQDRMRYLESIESIKHAMLFMNCRSSAGASLSHIHTQLIGSPIISDQLLGRTQRNEQHVLEHGKPLLESLANWESQQQVRMVFQSDHFFVFCPFASRFPFQIWIVPKHSQRKFVDCPNQMRDELARNCRWLIAQIEELLESPGYNLLLHQAPFSLAANDHWYFEILPRLTRPAGFEWGTDIWVNPVAPETAAKRLRLK